MGINAILVLAAACLSQADLEKDAGKAKKDKKPNFTVSKETTYALGPKTKTGHIDYFAALNERLGKGVTPETNANVLLFRALGPKPEGAAMPKGFFKMLGMERPPEKGDYFIDLFEHMKETGKEDPLKWTEEKRQALFDEMELAARRPWKAKEMPHIAAWLKANEKPLALTIEASKRPQYFLPLMTHEPEKHGLIGALLPSVQKCRRLGSILVTRAMLRLGEGKTEEAWQDLLTCHRLARHVAHGGTLIEHLVGIALDGIAIEASLAFLEGAGLDAKAVQAKRRELAALGALPPMANSVDVAERFMILDGVMMIDRGGLGYLEGVSGGKGNPGLDLLSRIALANIEWDPALKKINHYYDRLVAALRQKDFAERNRKVAHLENELKKLRGPQKMTMFLFGGKSGKERGEILSGILLSLLVPAVAKVSQAEFRAEQHQRNLQAAFALEAFRSDQGRYPKKLDDLTPKYLKTVPGDVFSGKALIYRPEENGYLLYSVGPNLRDEGGRYYDHGQDPPGDDPRVRMPLPKP